MITPTPRDAIAGALFDFLGFLTTRDKPVSFGATEWAAPAADLLKEWSALRGLSLDAPAIDAWRSALESLPAPVAIVYPPDGTVSPFTVINLGTGRVQMGDSIHDGRLPALWFGKNGQGMGHEEVMNRHAHEGETLAVVTFSNVEGLDVLADVIQRIRRASFPGAAPVTQEPNHG